MITLKIAFLITGLALILGFSPLIFAADRYEKLLRSFPRSKLPAYILTALALAWSVFAILDAHIEWIDASPGRIVVLAPILYLMIVYSMSELLAVRALGGIFMLAGRPLLSAAFPYETNVRLFVTVFAYVLVVFGMVLVWSPYMFRKLTDKLFKNKLRVSVTGWAMPVFGLVYILIGIFIF
ncbi:MAG: hypothetical protein GX811_08345 [Lentisphaerae bacterium]|nr:hypothetical protein [Lentisphaerota bacterium]